MRRLRTGLLVVAGLACCCLAGAWSARSEPPKTEHWVFESRPHRLDRLYSSMAGPGESQAGIALVKEEDQLLWLTGYRVHAVETSHPDEIRGEFLCHNNLFLDGTVEGYRDLLGTRAYGSPRLFTLAQGSDEIAFPEGYAIPVPSRQRLQMRTQVLSLLPENMGKTVNHRIQADFVRDNDLHQRPIPLFLVEAAGKVVLNDPGAAGPTGEKPAAETFSTDRSGRVFTGHWLVPPGAHTNVTRVTKAMALPFDTSAHTIASHLHPYAKWQELRDLSTGQVVHRAEARSSADGRSLAGVTSYSSAKGIPLFFDHEYELVTHYENTSSEPVTAMSMLFLYCEDREFIHYDPSREVKVVSAPIADSEADFCAAKMPGAPATPAPQPAQAHRASR